MDDDDDWLDESGTHESGQGGAADPLADKEYERISSRYADAGYREGITDGKLATLQEGFDQSFALSVPPSRRLGNLRGRVTALLSFLTLPTSTSNPDIVNQVRSLLADLNRVKRNDVLPADEERLEHERIEHPDESGAVLDVNDGREMEGLEEAISNMNGRGPDSRGVQPDKVLKEKELLDAFEGRLVEIQTLVAQSRRN